jgi:hypothetical protein
LIQPRQKQDTDGDGFHVPEANTKETKKVRFWRVCRGQQRAWYVWREVFKNLGDPIISSNGEIRLKGKLLLTLKEGCQRSSKLYQKRTLKVCHLRRAIHEDCRLLFSLMLKIKETKNGEVDNDT